MEKAREFGEVGILESKESSHWFECMANMNRYQGVNKDRRKERQREDGLKGKEWEEGGHLGIGEIICGHCQSTNRQ